MCRSLNTCMVRIKLIHSLVEHCISMQQRDSIYIHTGMYIVCGNLSCQGAARGYLFIMISGKQKGLMPRLMQTESNTTLTSSRQKFITIFLSMADASKQWPGTDRAGANHGVQGKAKQLPATSMPGWETTSAASSHAMTSSSYWILSSAESKWANALWRQHQNQVGGL